MFLDKGISAIYGYHGHYDLIIGKLSDFCWQLHIHIVKKMMKLCDYKAANGLKCIAHNWIHPNCMQFSYKPAKTLSRACSVDINSIPVHIHMYIYICIYIYNTCEFWAAVEEQDGDVGAELQHGLHSIVRHLLTAVHVDLLGTTRHIHIQRVNKIERRQLKYT